VNAEALLALIAELYASLHAATKRAEQAETELAELKKGGG
jgi:hypothetical protein